MKNKVTLKILNQNCAQDQNALQKTLESTPHYWKIISLELPSKKAALETFQALPEGKLHSDKFILGIYNSNGLMIGCIDIVRGFPSLETAMLGLLLISESEQKKGYGRLAFEAIQNFIYSWEEIKKIRIGVIATNVSALSFWRHIGFIETTERRPYQNKGVISEIIVLEFNIFIHQSIKALPTTK